jgi:lipopolysaccharide export system protein LptA
LQRTLAARRHPDDTRAMIRADLRFLPACRALAVAGLCLGAGPHAAAATPADAAATAAAPWPIHISADASTLDELAQVRILTGGVQAQAGPLRFTAARALVDEQGPAPDLLFDGPGAVRFTQPRSGLGDVRVEGQAGRIAYDPRRQRITLFAHAVLRQLQGTRVLDEVRGDGIVDDVASQTYSARTVSAAPGAAGRITLVIGAR